MAALGQAARRNGSGMVDALGTAAAQLGRAASLGRAIAGACALFARTVEVGRDVEAAPLKDRRKVAARLFD
jgi:hypothetical protein